MPAVDDVPAQLCGYRILGYLGRGGTCTVYRARQDSMEREVALKLLTPDRAANPTWRRRFLREAHLGGNISHTNVVAYHDLQEEDGWLLMALEYVPGGDLRELIRRHKGKVPERLALGLARDVACGLEALARNGVVHRDIKPSNIFMTEDMIPKIADFGAAQPAAAALQARDEDTRRKVVIGTPCYMPPEQAKRGARVDARADIHALGATLWHMLFGSPPYEAEDPQRCIELVRKGPMPDPARQKRRVMSATRRLLRTALAKDPGERYQTPRSMVEAIDRALYQTEHGDRNATVIEPFSQSSKPPAHHATMPWSWTAF